jgi:phenylacetate-CoA ligase
VDTLSEAASLLPAPPARLRQDTATQRAFLPRVNRSVRELRRGTQLGAADRPWIEARLARLVRRMAASPYYREALAARGLSPRDLRLLGNLPQFPSLDRTTLVARWRDLAAAWPDEEPDLVVVRSSGTTGEPAPVPRDRYDCLHMWAVLRFWLRALEIRLPSQPRVALLDALPGGLEYVADLPLLRDGKLVRISLVRKEPLARLRAFSPHVLFSDPEGLNWLQAQPDPPQPRLVLTSALPFGVAQRTALARVVAAPVVNYYATTETGPIAWECPRALGLFHVLVPDVWLEVESGEILVTRLRDSALPLLRYRTGDQARLAEEACVCGQRGPVLRDLSVRRACRFRRPDGATVDAWALAWLFKQVPLRAFRLVQVGPQAFRLELSADQRNQACAPLSLRSLRGRLLEALRLQGFPSPRLEMRLALGTAHAAKPEPFACEWPRAGPTRQRS